MSAPRIAPPPADVVAANVAAALAEDLGPGDATASLLDDAPDSAYLLCKEDCVLAGRPWFDAVHRALDPDVRIDFIAKYLGESRANLYRKMKLTPPQFPNPIKRGRGSFWPFSLVEAYRKGEWKPQPAVSKETSS